MENEILQLKREIEQLKKEIEILKQHTHTGLDGSKKPEYLELPERGVIYFGRGVSLQGPAAGVKDPSQRRGGLLITGDLYCKVVWAQYDILCNNIYPNSSSVYDLGSTSRYWKTLFVNNIYFNPSFGIVYWGGSIISSLRSISVDYSYGRAEEKRCVLCPADDLNGHLGLRAGYDGSSITRRWRVAHIGWTVTDFVHPPLSDTGSCGVPWRYWNAVYASTYYGKNTAIQSFEEEDDIELLKSIKEKKDGDKTYFDVSHIAKIKGKNGLVNLNALNGFLIGVLKKIVEKIENLEERLNNLENKNA